MATNPRTGTVMVVGGGRYQLIRALGGGNFGRVWLAEDLDEGDQVAVKLFDPQVQPDPVLVEARLQRKLSELPRIVPLRNIDVRSGGAPIIAMKYMAGGSVAERVDAGLPALPLALRWTRDVLEALAGAHAEGIVHRDVKPKNALLDDSGHALLSDFGISEDTLRNLLNTTVLYPPVAAPEILAGAHTSPRTDIYAVGCFIYYLLTGDYPYWHPTEAQAGNCEKVHRVNLQVPLAVSRIVHRALDTDPTARFEDGGDMLGEVAKQRVTASWTEVADPAFEGLWEAEGAAAPYRVTIEARKRGGFEVRANAGAGRRLLKARREAADSLAGARKIARGWLVQVVEGGQL